MVFLVVIPFAVQTIISLRGGERLADRSQHRSMAAAS